LNSQVAFFDADSGPDDFEQLSLADELSCPLNQSDQDIEGTASQVDR
jgi:hypothetical protein